MTLGGEIGIWADVLSPALADRIVAPIVASGLQVPWALFKRGPFSVGYPRFPVGFESSDANVVPIWQEIRDSMRSLDVDLLRVSVPESIAAAFNPSSIEARLPETVIESLQDWRSDRLSAGMRRKFRSAEKVGLRAEPAGATDGGTCHQLYLRTVSRQKGIARYNADYFDRLCQAGARGGPVNVIKAMTIDGRVAGFVATLHLGTTAYYLHGGYADDMATARPGYFLMRHAIERARNDNIGRFNMLTSPSRQPELRAYKESFGGKTHERIYWSEPLGALGSVLRLVLHGKSLLQSRT